MIRHLDHTGAVPHETVWRTLLVFAHTLFGSGMVLLRAALSKVFGQGVVASNASTVNRVIDRWVVNVFGLSRTTLDSKGTQALASGQSYVLVSNHRSLLDIPAIAGTFPGSLRFVAKQELRKVPLFGAAMASAGVIFIDRNNTQDAIEKLKLAQGLKDEGHSVWVAAEGGRNTTDQLLPLKKGPLHLANDLKVPLLPVWIDGTDRVIPPNGLRATTGLRVRVLYGPPLPPTDDIDGQQTRLRASLLALQSAMEEFDQTSAEVALEG